MFPIHTRIAPTPSGFLHLGNAFSFILTWLLVRKSGGSLALRIDDLDAERSKEVYLEDIFESLNWLGLDYDTGAQNVRDFIQHYSQKLRIQEYENTLIDLKNSKEFIYACDCSRKTIQSQSKNGLYPNSCRNRNLDFEAKEAAWRVYVPDNQWVEISDCIKGTIKINLTAKMGDFVIRRRDGIAAYQLTSLMDDIRMGVDFIVRGEDLIYSTATQLYLAEKLDLKSFKHTIFLHHPLIYESFNQKMSKSHKSLSLKELRKAWIKPLKVYQIVARMLKIDKSISSLDELLEEFNPDKFNMKPMFLNEILD